MEKQLQVWALKWPFHILIFATDSGKYQNKEKPLKRKLGLTPGMGGGSRKFRQGWWWVLTSFLKSSTYFTEAVRTSCECPIASRGGSVPVFLRKPIATCDYLGGYGPLAPPPLDPPILLSSVVDLYKQYGLSSGPIKDRV